MPESSRQGATTGVMRGAKDRKWERTRSLHASKAQGIVDVGGGD